MSRQPRIRRHPPGSGRGPAPSGLVLPPRLDAGVLLRQLAQASSLAEVLPLLHEYALEVTGGSCVILFEHNPRTAVLRATSGYGLDVLRTEPWRGGHDEDVLIADVSARRLATLVSDLPRQMPELAGRLTTSEALLVPLHRDSDRLGLLAIGFREPAGARAFDTNVTSIADAFVATLQLFRLRRRERLDRDLEELQELFAALLARSLEIPPALTRVCERATAIFGADRASVWLHDRQARELVLSASSDHEHLAEQMRLSADDPWAPAALALRHARADLASGSVDGEPDTVTVPLRGCRRALGALLFEGVRVEAGDELALLERADQLGRDLSSRLESALLIEQAISDRFVPDPRPT